MTGKPSSAEARRPRRAHARHPRPLHGLPSGREHRERRVRSLADQRHLLARRRHLHDERDRAHARPVACDLGLPGDADLLLRRRVLQPRHLRVVPPARAQHWTFIRGRLERLLRPSIIFLGLWVLIQIVLHLADVGRPTGPKLWGDTHLLRGMFPPGSTLPFGPLWFLGMYMIVVSISPLTIRSINAIGGSSPPSSSPGRSPPTSSVSGSASAASATRTSRSCSSSPSARPLLRRRHLREAAAEGLRGMVAVGLGDADPAHQPVPLQSHRRSRSLRLVPRASATTRAASSAPTWSRSRTPIHRRCATWPSGSGRSAPSCCSATGSAAGSRSRDLGRRRSSPTASS